MTHANNPAIDAIQIDDTRIDEDILYVSAASDEALEAAAGKVNGALNGTALPPHSISYCC